MSSSHPPINSNVIDENTGCGIHLDPGSRYSGVMSNIFSVAGVRSRLSVCGPHNTVNSSIQR